MTRATLLAQLGRRLNKASSLDAATSARLVDLLNEAQREILSDPGLQWLREESITFASVASQATYGLANVGKVNRIFEATNQRVLLPLTRDQYRDLSPSIIATSGTADAWVPFGYAPVAAQPTTAAGVALFVKSSAAGDTTQTCYLEGEQVGGYPRAVSVTLNGTTAVNVAAAVTDWIRVTKLYLSAAPVGQVTLTTVSGAGTELARIGIGQTMQHYCAVALYPMPSTVITYTADVLLDITDLAQDTDEPRLPRDFHDLILHLARMNEYEKTDDDRYAVAEKRYLKRMAQFKLWMHETAAGSTRIEDAWGRSRLGPWFPAGS